MSDHAELISSHESRLKKGAIMRLGDFINQSNRADNPEELFTLLVQAAQELGFDYIAYMALSSRENHSEKTSIKLKNHPPPFIKTNFPDFWIQHYYDHNYRNIDPVLIHSPHMQEPFLWKSLPGRVRLDDSQKLLLKEAEAAGLKSGISIPLHGPHTQVFIVSFAAGEEHPEAGLNSHILFMLAVQFHRAYGKWLETTPAPASLLTPRELDCLQWIARGKSSWETGVILGVSETTINFHVREVMGKLNASKAR